MYVGKESVWILEPRCLVQTRGENLKRGIPRTFCSISPPPSVRQTSSPSRLISLPLPTPHTFPLFPESPPEEPFMNPTVTEGGEGAGERRREGGGLRKGAIYRQFAHNVAGLFAVPRMFVLAVAPLAWEEGKRSEGGRHSFYSPLSLFPLSHPDRC